MRMNKYLASTLFTGLFITTAVFSPAQGQEQSLQPQGAWALTKVDRSAQGGNSYCTLSRKYDDNIVLSLGRNQTEEYSLAIDFQKQTFEKDKSLKINLQPGPGQIRAYDMMPTSDKALVIRLGWDTGFFDALNSSQQMKVKIADKSYAFAMPEVAKGQSDLKDCMEGLKAAAKGGETAPQTKDVLNAEAGGSKDFDAGKVDGAVAVASAADAKAQVAEQEKSILKNFADSITAQEPPIARGDDEAPKRKNFNANKQLEKPAPAPTPAPEITTAAKTEAPLPPPMVKPDLAPELVKRPAPSKPAIVAEADMDAPKPFTTKAPVVAAPEPALAKIAPAASGDTARMDEVASLQKRLDQLTAENAALKQKAVADTGPSPETQKKIESLAAERQALQDKVAALEAESAQKAKPEDVAKIEARAKELEIKNAQLEESLRNAQVRIGETAVNTEAKALRMIADLEVKLEAAKTDNAALAKQMESLKTQQEDGRLAVVAGDWDLEQATKRFNEAEREIKRLGQQLEQERMSCNREKAEIEQMLFDPVLTEKKQLERLTALESELNSAKAQIADQVKLVQGAVDQQLAAKTQAIDAEKAAMAQQLATVQKELVAAKAQPKTDPAAVQQQIAAEVAKAKAASDAQLASIQKTLATKEQELAAAKAQPKVDTSATAQQIAAEVAKVKAASDAQMSALQKTLATKEQELAAAKAQPKVDPSATAQQIAAEVAKTKAATDAQIASLQKTLATKEQELVTAKAQPKADPAATAQQIAAEVAKVRAASDAEIAALKETLTAKEQQIATIQATPRTDPAIMKQVADLQTSMADLKKNNEALRDQNIMLRSESDKLRLQVTDAATNGGKRADQVASMQLQLDELKQQVVRKDTQNLTYQNQLAVLQQETAQLKTRLASADTVRTSSTEEVGELTRQVQTLQKQIADMDARDRAAARSASAAQTVAAVAPAAGGSVYTQAVATTSGYDAGSIKSLLQKAGLSVGSVQKTAGMAGADNFGWTDGGNVKGVASVKASSGNFDGMVDQYIAHQKSLCGSGDFASMPSPSNSGAAKRMALYEVACVSGGNSTSSSMLFFEDQGRFIAISNEIGAADMDIAMDSRDKIAGFVRGL